MITCFYIHFRFSIIIEGARLSANFFASSELILITVLDDLTTIFLTSFEKAKSNNKRITIKNLKNNLQILIFLSYLI